MVYQHDSNRELLGQGLGNLVSSLIGGVPVTGAVARSGINVVAAGRTQAVWHITFYLPSLDGFSFCSCSPAHTPGFPGCILMVASVRTADWKSIRLLPRVRWTYGGIMIITTVLTVVMDLAVAVIVGVILSAVVALFDLAHLPEGRKTEGKMSLHGPLLFVGVEKLKEQLAMIVKKVNWCWTLLLSPILTRAGPWPCRSCFCRGGERKETIYRQVEALTYHAGFGLKTYLLKQLSTELQIYLRFILAVRANSRWITLITQKNFLRR